MAENSAPTLADRIREAFEEGYALGFEHGEDPRGPGKPIIGGGGCQDPYDPDVLWEESEARKALGPLAPAFEEEVDVFTRVTRDMARSS